MRKTIKKILFLILLLISVNVVSAESISDACEKLPLLYPEMKNENFKFAESTFGIRINLSDGNRTAVIIYPLKKSGSTTYYQAFCRNPGVSSGAIDANSTFSCKREIFVPEASDYSNDEKGAYEAGVVAIMSADNGYTGNGELGMLNDDTEKFEYSVTSIALRVYEMLWATKDSNTDKIVDDANEKIMNTFRAYANDYMKTDEYKEYYESLVSNNQHYLRKTNYTPGFNITGFSDEKVKPETDELIGIGLKAALDYKTHGAAAVNVSSKIEKDESTSTEQKKVITYNIDINHFKTKANSSAYVKLNFNCSNCNSIGAKYKITVNGQDITNKSDYDLLKLSDLTDGAGNVELKIEFTSTNIRECATAPKLEYNLSIEYYDESINKQVFEMASNEKACETGVCQGFYMLYNEGEEVNHPYTINDEISFCTDRRPECTTKFTNALCTANGSTLEITEGYEKDSADVCLNSNNKVNVQACIIEKSDTAGNPYKADYVESSNKYCQIYCKEDYKIKLPGEKYANTGRYFTLHASITGTKTCYTSEIQNDLFERNITSISNEIKRLHNKWLQNKTEENEKTLELKIQEYRNELREYDSCINWTMDYNYDPKISFWYEESFIDKANKQLVTNGTINKDQTATIGVCNNKTADNSYSNCTDATVGTTGKNLYICAKVANNTFLCGTEGQRIFTSDYIKKTMNVKANYITPTQFYNIYPTGGIVIAYGNTQIPNASPLENALPIGFGTLSGTYKYALKIDNLGEYYDSDKLGRIWGEAESVVTSMLNDSCTPTGGIKHNHVESGFENGVFVCKYTVNGNPEEPICPDGTDKAGTDYLSNPDYIACLNNGNTKDYCINQVCNVPQVEPTCPSDSDKPNYKYKNDSEYISCRNSGGTEETCMKVVCYEPENPGTTDVTCPSDSDKPNYKYKNDPEYISCRNSGGTEETCVKVVCYLPEDPRTYSCEVVDGKYYLKDGNLATSYAQYKAICCPSGKCPIVCRNCIIADGELNIEYRPITPGDLNPNDKDLGENWKFDENNIKTGLELKAYATTKEIMEKGETIYDITFDSTSTEFAMKVTLDSKMITKIRDYNDRHASEGYLNNTLMCYDYIDGTNTTYENTFCYSTFIDELLYDNDTKDNIEITPSGSRIIAGNAIATDNLRKTKTQLSGYWTTWSMANDSRWNVKTQYGIAYYKEGYGTNINIGPSWK